MKTMGHFSIHPCFWGPKLINPWAYIRKSAIKSFLLLLPMQSEKRRVTENAEFPRLEVLFLKTIISWNDYNGMVSVIWRHLIFTSILCVVIFKACRFIYIYYTEIWIDEIQMNLWIQKFILLTKNKIWQTLYEKKVHV